MLSHADDKGVLSDATKSVSRAYINNFQDKGKQIAIDMLVVSRFASATATCLILCKGNFSTQKRVTIYDPIHDSVRRALDARYAIHGFQFRLTQFDQYDRLSEYSTTKPCTIFTGTWNLNGRVRTSAIACFLADCNV